MCSRISGVSVHGTCSGGATNNSYEFESFGGGGGLGQGGVTGPSHPESSHKAGSSLREKADTFVKRARELLEC